MSSDMALATATTSDAAEIAGLVDVVFGEFRFEFAPTALRWDAAAIAAVTDDWLTARSHGALIGAIRHEVDDEGYTCDSLCVRADGRRRGVGSALVREAERKAREHGAVRMLVAVRRGIAANVALVEHLGYLRERPFGEQHDLYARTLAFIPEAAG